MKDNLLFLLTVLSPIFTFCQSNDEATYIRVKRDTINITGIITDTNGRPIPQICIRSLAKSLTYHNYPLTTCTDSSGTFKLLGAQFNDTLTIDRRIKYEPKTIYNQGSRYVKIILLPKSTSEEKDFPVVQAKRIKKGAEPATFKINDSFVCILPTLSLGPEFPGGKKKLYEFLLSKVIYPQEAIASNLEGKVTIGFDVGKDGLLSNFEVINGIGMKCEEAVISALKQGPKWMPAIENTPVVCKESVSFIFKLTE